MLRKRLGSTSWLRPTRTGRKLALTVLGSNLWPVVRDHAAAIAARVDAAISGSYHFTEMPLPQKRRLDS
jgi:hypothetical protein